MEGRVFDTPMYAPVVAARLTGLDASRVRRWLQGYEYTYMSKAAAKTRRRQSPLVHRAGTAGSRYASFIDLIDLLFVKHFVDHGTSVQRLRKALDEAAALTGDHHFAQRHFWTDDRRLYLELKDTPAEALLELLTGGQWVIAPVIKQVAHQIEFDNDTGLSRRWFPLGKKRAVVIDPSVAFGAPTLIGRGVQTANIFDLYRGEKGNVNRVAAWMDVPKEAVEDAVEFERTLAAA